MGSRDARPPASDGTVTRPLEIDIRFSTSFPTGAHVGSGRRRALITEEEEVASLRCAGVGGGGRARGGSGVPRG